MTYDMNLMCYITFKLESIECIPLYMPLEEIQNHYMNTQVFWPPRN